MKHNKQKPLPHYVLEVQDIEIIPALPDVNLGDAPKSHYVLEVQDMTIKLIGGFSYGQITR